MTRAATAERDGKGEILTRIEAWAGSAEKAREWYETYPIPSLAGKTAEELVDDGRISAVRQFLDRIAVGGFA